ncbi:hypothetical protein [Streptomyces sp. NBC_00239]|uniref:hypothetical protein n=1 Tax=Streptomyces sp. NBC_00239 TaxID=2903640 RepID=UPI002E2D4714|nr:hypothetical protein [Streptomyces sp. NBC_00239]
MTATVETASDSLTSALRLPVWKALADRAEALRRALPARPDDAAERWHWWQGMTGEQQRRAALLEHLDALCGHLTGRPALGYAAHDPLPLAALEEADGFTSEPVAELIAAYRAAPRDSEGGQPLDALQPSQMPARV